MKKYFKGKASKKAYDITFSISIGIMVLMALAMYFIYKADVNEDTMFVVFIFFAVAILIVGRFLLWSQNLSLEKKRENEMFDQVSVMLTDEWQQVTFDYYSTEIPEIMKPLCYDFAMEAKLVDKIIFIRCNECNGRYVKEMQTTDYEWFSKYFEIEF